jgi:hypothetical protein
MTVTPGPRKSLATRQKLILAGLYLSKYDEIGLKRLGFDSFHEAFNVVGYSLGSRPASIKNYRDEFDPLFPNARKGWHKRPIRSYCLVSRKKVVFVHGCFWHMHRCRQGRKLPAINVGYWTTKLEKNVARDMENIKALRKSGWGVLVIWECWTRDAVALSEKLNAFLRGKLQ